ncbi:MAG: hypothetical protein D3908_06825, partial [Candidatus Electrothrix sp. AUS4]|nr:hypothetical protein [Candidatus Electrothrix sp. AUS4]
VIESEVHPFLIGDAVRLQQILLNFLNNAIKFTESGGVFVHIAVQEDDGKQVLLKISVEDSGIGIPQDRMTRMFQTFSQADASTSRKYGGTGLGLAICKRLSELMGGEVGVQSKAGEGSTFWCTVRVEKTSEDTLLSEKESTHFHDTLPSIPNILLVEDNKINQYVALSLLKKNSCLLMWLRMELRPLRCSGKKSMMWFLWIFRCRKWMVLRLHVILVTQPLESCVRMCL